MKTLSASKCDVEMDPDATVADLLAAAAAHPSIGPVTPGWTLRLFYGAKLLDPSQTLRHAGLVHESSVLLYFNYAPPLSDPSLAVIPEAALTIDTSPAGKLGEGAFGVVRREQWNRVPVAAKSLQRDAADVGDEPARNFDREMQVLAHLKHPNVVPVFGVCHHADGRVTLVEELLAGGTLSKRLRAAGGSGGGGGGGPARWPVAEVARVGLDVANALAFAHGAGVTHNDLKPENVLFNAGGAAVLVDFGLAKRVAGALPNTFAARLRASSGMGGLLGTYTIAAPENWNEKTKGYGQPPGDIYSLGLLLFEAAAGVEPWAGKSIMEVAVAVSAGRRPEIPAGVDARLARLIVRCWDPNPNERPSAQAVADELAARLREEDTPVPPVPPPPPVPPIRPVPPAPIGGGWVCPSCTLVNAAGAAACVLCLKPRNAGGRACTVCALANPDRAEACGAFVHERVPRHTGGQLSARCVATLDHGAGYVYALAMVEGAGLVSGGSRHTRVWAQGADRGLKSIAGKVSTWNSIAALPGGRFATAGYDTNLAEVWDAGTGTRLHQLRGHTDYVWCVAALPGGLLASGSFDKTVRIWNAATGAHVSTLEGHTSTVYALAALPDGRLASGSYDETIRLWNVATCACTQVLQHPHSVYALAVLDGGRLASGCKDNRVYIWSLAGGVQEAVLAGHTNWVHTNWVGSLAALPNGLLASGSDDKTVRVWDVGARACVAVLEGHALAALPDGRLASGSWGDPLIRVWTLSAPGSPEDAAAATAEARRVVVAPAP